MPASPEFVERKRSHDQNIWLFDSRHVSEKEACKWLRVSFDEDDCYEYEFVGCRLVGQNTWRMSEASETWPEPEFLVVRRRDFDMDRIMIGVWRR